MHYTPLACEKHHMFRVEFFGSSKFSLVDICRDHLFQVALALLYCST